jgi:outer membrane receptor protein involved in Fe transport
MKKSVWLMSAGLFAIAAPAAAQTSSGAPVAEAATSTQTSAGNEETPVQGDIIVTAQRRSESLSNVPLAISAVTAETLANTGANDIRQLNQVAPSLLVSSTGSEANGSARIRGVGTVGDNPGLESSVAVFIDGVYRSRSGIGLSELGEIERVEVLRGPQGTLFGRNASAGLIHVISKKPAFTFGANAELTYGNYDFLRASGSVTGPITETIAARLDGVWVQRDGFYRDINNGTDVNDRDRYFVRGQLLVEPNDALSLRLIGDYTKRDEKCCGAVYVNREINPLVGDLNEPATPIATGGVINPAGNNIINVLRDLGQTLNAFRDPYSRRIYVTPGRSYAGETEDRGVSLEASYDFGGATLTSISAYREYNSDQGSDTDYSTVDILYRADEWRCIPRVQDPEPGAASAGAAFNDRVDWLIGGYFADEDLTVTDNLRLRQAVWPLRDLPPRERHRLACAALLARLSRLSCRPPAAFGPASPLIFAGFDRLDGLERPRKYARPVFPEQPQLRDFHAQHLPCDRHDQSDVGRPLHERTQALQRDLRQRQRRLPGAAGGARLVTHEPGLGRARGRPDRPHLPRQFHCRTQWRDDPRSSQRGGVHRHGRALGQAHQRPSALRQLLTGL